MEGNRKTGNIFEALVERKVEKKVAQKQQQPKPKPKPKPAPQPTPTQQLRVQLRNQAEQLLRTAPWREGNHTYSRPLNNTVLSNQQQLQAHVTINKTDIQNACAVVQLGDTLATVFSRTGYHVTFEEYDDEANPNNPRWYSDNRRWQVQGYHVGLQNLAQAQAVVQEGTDIITALRT